MLGLAPSADGCAPDRCSIDTVRVVNDLVGYSSNESGRSGNVNRIEVLDMATGRTVIDIPAGRFHPEDKPACSANGESDYTGIGQVTDLALRSDRVMSWIAQRQCGPGQPYEVWQRTIAGSTRLDYGGTIGRTSLAFVPSAIAWTEDAVPRTNPLPPRASR